MRQVKAKFYRRHIAIGYCESCNDTIISPGGGIFIRCYCGKSYIDQERFEGVYVRIGGDCKFIEQICPITCKHKEHGR